MGAAAMFGSHKPLLILGAAIAGTGLVYAARRPVLALVIIVAIEASNLSGVLEAHGSIPMIKAAVTLGALAIALALRDPELRGRLNAWTVICGCLAALFFSTQLVAFIGDAPEDAPEELQAMAQKVQAIERYLTEIPVAAGPMAQAAE